MRSFAALSRGGEKPGPGRCPNIRSIIGSINIKNHHQYHHYHHPPLSVRTYLLLLHYTYNAVRVHTAAADRQHGCCHKITKLLSHIIPVRIIPFLLPADLPPTVRGKPSSSSTTDDATAEAPDATPGNGGGGDWGRGGGGGDVGGGASNDDSCPAPLSTSSTAGPWPWPWP